MSRAGIELGFKGEELAANFLRKGGYKIVKRNYRTRLGQIDIIAKDNGILCFIEVKSRQSSFLGAPEEAISLKKKRQVSKVALFFLKKNNLINTNARFDVVSILFNRHGPTVKLIKNAFELEGRYAY